MRCNVDGLAKVVIDAVHRYYQRRARVIPIRMQPLSSGMNIPRTFSISFTASIASAPEIKEAMTESPMVLTTRPREAKAWNRWRKCSCTN